MIHVAKTRCSLCDLLCVRISWRWRQMQRASSSPRSVNRLHRDSVEALGHLRNQEIIPLDISILWIIASQAKNDQGGRSPPPPPPPPTKRGRRRRTTKQLHPLSQQLPRRRSTFPWKRTDNRGEGLRRRIERDGPTAPQGQHNSAYGCHQTRLRRYVCARHDL